MKKTKTALTVLTLPIMLIVKLIEVIFVAPVRRTAKAVKSK